jgi:hypothetical protein
MEYIIVSITVFLFSYLRTHTTNAVIDKDLIKGSLYVGGLQSLWVISTGIGTKAIVEGDNALVMGIIYVFFAILGFIAAMLRR